jgi:uncharacterized damage-inducible protein DinB
MTVQEIRMLFAYNSWATSRVFDVLGPLSDELIRHDLRTGHESVFGTLTHLVESERVWLARWLGKPAQRNETAAPTLDALKSAWEKVAAETARFVGKLTEEKMSADLQYANSKGEKFAQPLVQSLQHVVNHSTYHRGQVASMMRQVGAEPTNTDLITFYRLTRH